MYGTLLGLVRENSCIDNDDDIDIIIDKVYYDVIKTKLKAHNIEFEYSYGIRRSRKILKTKATSKYASIDIYMGDFSDNDVYDEWNKLNIKDCYFDK